jgi:hypothetical protein
MVEPVIKLVRSGAVIQGGAFRLDKGPTATEFRTFELAVETVRQARGTGMEVKLACIVNDMGVKPEERPKRTGIFTFPDEYVLLLRAACIPVADVMIFYESTLRNRVAKDISRGMNVARKVNEESGLEVPICTSIMGRFYTDLAAQGVPQGIGFYAQEPRPRDDKACPWGPSKGADERQSGYPLRLEVLTYFVRPDGYIVVGGIFEPKKEEEM